MTQIEARQQRPARSTPGLHRIRFVERVWMEFLTNGPNPNGPPDGVRRARLYVGRGKAQVARIDMFWPKGDGEQQCHIHYAPVEPNGGDSFTYDVKKGQDPISAAFEHYFTVHAFQAVLHRGGAPAAARHITRRALESAAGQILGIDMAWKEAQVPKAV
jgi:hypothetical protein